MYDVNDISTSLCRWAVKEMGFCVSENCVLLPDHLAGICLGPLADVWSFITKHVKSETTVYKVKGNLMLHAPAEIQDSEKTLLLNKKDTLKLEVLEMERMVKLLNENIIETKMVLAEKEAEFRTVRFHYQELKRFTKLTLMARNLIQENVKKLKQTNQSLKFLMQSLVPQQKADAEFDQYRVEVDHMCKLMESSLSDLIGENSNHDAIQNVKMEVGNTLATILDRFPHLPLLQFVEETQDQKLALKKKIDSFILLSDQDKKGANDARVLQSLQHLLHKLSWYHADCHLQAREARQRAVISNNQKEMLRNDIHRLLTTANDAEYVKIAEPRIDSELQVASRIAVITVFRKTKEDLERFCTGSTNSEQEMKKEIEEIHRNSRISNHLSLLMCTLARKHFLFPEILEQSALQISKTWNSTLKDADRHLRKIIGITEQNVGRELEMSQQLRPIPFFNVVNEGKPNSVNRLGFLRLQIVKRGRNFGNEILERTLLKLELTQCLPVFNVFDCITRTHFMIWKLTRSIEWYETRQQEIAEKYGGSWLEQNTVRYKELTGQLIGKRQVEEAELLPLLDYRLRKMEIASQLTADVHSALNKWLEEPAKLIETGREVNGQTLEQWRHHWNKSLALCRKKK